MSWRRVGLIYVALAVLAAYVFLIDRGPATTPPADGHAPVGPSLLDVNAAAVSAVAFHEGGRTLRAARHDGRWQVLEPPGVVVPSDLLEATIATLTVGQSAEVLAEQPEHELAAYGLATPSATLDVVIANAAPVTVSVGARNPTRTAVYARRSDRPAIYLVGMNLSYYLDLIFERVPS